MKTNNFTQKAIMQGFHPETWYHGTDKDITSFQPRRARGQQMGLEGIHLAQNPDFANLYADKKGGNVMPLHVTGNYLDSNVLIKQNSKEHKILDDLLKNTGKKPYWSKDENGVFWAPPLASYIDSVTPQKAEKVIKSYGYDGVKYVANYGNLLAGGKGANISNKSPALVVFDPNKIKSAIGSEYDINNPDITKSNGGMVADPKKAARAALHVVRHKNLPNRGNTAKRTSHNPAVAELKHLLTMHRDELRSMKGRTQYAAIDGIMKRISHEHGIAPSKLHDDWMSVYHQTPDAWVAGDHGNVVDRALKMTNRGGYAFGGSPAALAPATGAPINFAPAAGAFTGLPLPGTLNLAPSKATLAAILASRPTTYTGSSKPLESKYIGPSIAAPTFNASAYNLPDNPLEEGQGGSGDRWHPDASGGGNPGAANQSGDVGGSSGNAARGGRIHRANDDRVQHALSLTRHAALPGRQHTRGRP